MKYNRIILVPWDFTQVAEFAFQHAVNVAKAFRNEICLVHIVKKKKEIEEATQRMEQKIKELKEKYGAEADLLVKVGSIFSKITETTTEKDTDMVIMGTHGMKGMQKVTGSWALKVIAGSNVPFLVIQDAPQSDSFRDIVFPVDFKRENKEKVNWVVYLSRHYSNPKFHILKDKNTDRRLVKAVESNVLFTRRVLDTHRINYDIFRAEGHKDFAKETIEFAEKRNADLILILTTKDINIADYMLGAHEQYIIANSAKIPVMCINPRPSTVSGGFSASGG